MMEHEAKAQVEAASEAAERKMAEQLQEERELMKKQLEFQQRRLAEAKATAERQYMAGMASIQMEMDAAAETGRPKARKMPTEAAATSQAMEAAVEHWKAFEGTETTTFSTLMAAGLADDEDQELTAVDGQPQAHGLDSGGTLQAPQQRQQQQQSPQPLPMPQLPTGTSGPARTGRRLEGKQAFA
jgi:hypothetical protein